MAFMLEASIATVAVLMSTDGLTVQGEFNDAVYEADKLKLKLFAIGVICLLLAVRAGRLTSPVSCLHCRRACTPAHVLCQLPPCPAQRPPGAVLRAGAALDVARVATHSPCSSHTTAPRW